MHRLVDVGAVDDGVRIVESPPERFADRNARDFAAVDRVHHDEIVGVDRAPAGALADAERIHGGEPVGAELEAGADLADLGRLLEHFDGETGLAQRERGRHAADAAADDEHRCRRVDRAPIVALAQRSS